eukprot:CAMPEP_0194310260 /NCGR_PEP_ID=MMETSP0171-20130528/7191_1 /TAXON_ID=218684 /ORGANISM="Corethron pennatum, Strain L29A3" /LENGTH=49 /DNA_ID= /DNA_START= /DNA_END= /DNA_ORIENTATION=
MCPRDNPPSMHTSAGTIPIEPIRVRRIEHTPKETLRQNGDISPDEMCRR